VIIIAGILNKQSYKAFFVYCSNWLILSCITGFHITARANRCDLLTTDAVLLSTDGPP